MSNCPKVIVLLAVVAATIADGRMYETTRREPNFGIYAAEAGGGFLGAIGLGGTFAVATIIIPVMTDNYPNTPLEVYAGVSGVLGLIGCAGGTWLAGSGFVQQGKFLPALAYAAGTSAIGLGLCVGGTQLRNHNSHKSIGFSAGSGMLYSGIGLFIATPIAAVAGYNLSRPHDAYGSRFLPGSVALGAVSDADGVIHPSLDVRLLSFRF